MGKMQDPAQFTYGDVATGVICGVQVCCLLSSVCCPLSAVCCLLSAVCCLVFGVWS
jgi:hypothetical protein